MYTADSAIVAYDQFKVEWELEKQKEPEKISIYQSLKRSCGEGYGMSAFLHFLWMLTSFIPPLILAVLVSYLEGTRDLSNREIMTLLALLLVVPIFGSICLNRSTNYMVHIGFRCRSALSSALFRKSILLSSVARAQTSTGAAVNMMSQDGGFQFFLFLYVSVIRCVVPITFFSILAILTVSPYSYSSLPAFVVRSPSLLFLTHASPTF